MLHNKTFRLFAVVLVFGLGSHFYFNRGYPITNAHSHSGPIVAFGDSLTQGVGANEGETYPELLARMIGKPVINAGVGGNTIFDGERRLERDVLSRKPGIVIVLLGGNDILQRKDMKTSFESLERIVRRIQENGALVALVGIKVITPFGGVGGQYHDLARRTGCVYVGDILNGIFLDRSLMSDQIHPNSKGYAIMAERIAKGLRPYL